MTGSLGGPLELVDEGSFFVGGRTAWSSHPGASPFSAPQPGTIMINQMYVQYRIPRTVSGPTIVMVHGSGHTGATCETTPDGREGWCTYFARKGFPALCGRPFRPRPVGLRPDRNQRRPGSSGAGRTARHPDHSERARLVVLPHRHDLSEPVRGLAISSRGVRPVLRAARAQCRGHAAGRRRQHRAGARGPARPDRSGGGAGAFAVGRLRLDLVRARAPAMLALVNIEGNCAPVTADEVARPFSKVPLLAVWGDYSHGAIGPNGDARRNGCAATVAAIEAAGGRAGCCCCPRPGTAATATC